MKDRSVVNGKIIGTGIA